MSRLGWISKLSVSYWAIQRAIALGMLDVNTNVVTLASFMVEPREGNLDRARRVVSYLVKSTHVAINISTEDYVLSSMSITPYE